jgi:cob(I)alamin adenosyltransferase
MSGTKSSLYTRTGDAGETGLVGGTRAGKDGPRIRALGEVDELNCQLGCVRALQSDDSRFADTLEDLQHLLFELGAELAHPGAKRLSPSHVAWAEAAIDRLDADLPPLDRFLLPGGAPAGAQCHLARAVCRRAERSLFRLARTEQVNSDALRFMNRLSDLLFALARSLNRERGARETPWQSAPQDRG